MVIGLKRWFTHYSFVSTHYGKFGAFMYCSLSDGCGVWVGAPADPLDCALGVGRGTWRRWVSGVRAPRRLSETFADASLF